MRDRRGRVNVWVLGLGLAVVLPVIAVLAMSFGRNPRALPDMMTSRPAPAFALQTLEGEPVSLEALKGEPIVLNFWSTWCAPCKVEHPLLQQSASAWPDVHFLGVVYQDEPDAAKRYLTRAGTTYRHLLDPGGRVAIDYGVAGVPETYFIDRSGIIVHKESGPVSRDLMLRMMSRLQEDS